MNNLGWRSLVISDFMVRGVDIHLGVSRGDRFEYVTQISGDSQMTQMTVPENPGPMKLPEDAARALRDALNEFFGPEPNDFKARYEEARDALVKERERVDRLLGGSSAT